MPNLNASEIVVGSNGQINVAPVGTTLPAVNSDPTATLNSGFGYGLGYVTEDGVQISYSPEFEEIMAWQSPDAVRRDRTGREFTLSFELQQWNEQTVVLAFGGGQITTAGGFYTYQPPNTTDAIVERSLVLDWNDGSKRYRLVVPRGSVTDGTETQLQRGQEATLAVTFKAMQPTDGRDLFYLITNDSAWAVGS